MCDCKKMRYGKRQVPASASIVTGPNNVPTTVSWLEFAQTHWNQIYGPDSVYAQTGDLSTMGDSYLGFLLAAKEGCVAHSVKGLARWMAEISKGRKQQHEVVQKYHVLAIENRQEVIDKLS